MDKNSKFPREGEPYSGKELAGALVVVDATLNIAAP